MARSRTYNRRNILTIVSIIILVALGLTIRLGYLMIFRSEEYAARAQALHERERAIKAKRGRIFDRNGVEIATNKPVCT
ncbi:MAG TPA: peptidoglycan glycosyltransferase, partial [Lachnospiraceae bacterium]|nr:peptidoglycan glycosyltransferase [Lachnospiraceae bacterium]